MIIQKKDINTKGKGGKYCFFFPFKESTAATRMSEWDVETKNGIERGVREYHRFGIEEQLRGFRVLNPIPLLKLFFHMEEGRPGFDVTLVDNYYQKMVDESSTCSAMKTLEMTCLLSIFKGTSAVFVLIIEYILKKNERHEKPSAHTRALLDIALKKRDFSVEGRIEFDRFIPRIHPAYLSCKPFIGLDFQDKRLLGFDACMGAPETARLFMFACEMEYYEMADRVLQQEDAIRSLSDYKDERGMGILFELAFRNNRKMFSKASEIVSEACLNRKSNDGVHIIFTLMILDRMDILRELARKRDDLLLNTQSNGKYIWEMLIERNLFDDFIYLNSLFPITQPLECLIKVACQNRNYEFFLHIFEGKTNPVYSRPDMDGLLEIFYSHTMGCKISEYMLGIIGKHEILKPHMPLVDISCGLVRALNQRNANLALYLMNIDGIKLLAEEYHHTGNGLQVFPSSVVDLILRQNFLSHQDEAVYSLITHPKLSRIFDDGGWRLAVGCVFNHHHRLLKDLFENGKIEKIERKSQDNLNLLQLATTLSYVSVSTILFLVRTGKFDLEAVDGEGDTFYMTLIKDKGHVIHKNIINFFASGKLKISSRNAVTGKSLVRLAHEYMSVTDFKKLVEAGMRDLEFLEHFKQLLLEKGKVEHLLTQASLLFTLREIESMGINLSEEDKQSIKQYQFRERSGELCACNLFYLVQLCIEEKDINFKTGEMISGVFKRVLDITLKLPTELIMIICCKAYSMPLNSSTFLSSESIKLVEYGRK